MWAGSSYVCQPWALVGWSSLSPTTSQKYQPVVSAPAVTKTTAASNAYFRSHSLAGGHVSSTTMRVAPATSVSSFRARAIAFAHAAAEILPQYPLPDVRVPWGLALAGPVGADERAASARARPMSMRMPRPMPRMRRIRQLRPVSLFLRCLPLGCEVRPERPRGPLRPRGGCPRVACGRAVGWSGGGSNMGCHGRTRACPPSRSRNPSRSRLRAAAPIASASW
jgi:hypothetical protein